MYGQKTQGRSTSAFRLNSVQRRLGALACAIACVAGGTQRAHAETANELAAEASFVEGVALMKQASYTEALARFRESQRLSPASGTLLNIGYCERQLGHTASAWLSYRQALTLANASDKPEHVRIAQKESQTLEAKLARVSFRLFPAAASWQFSLDQSPFTPGTEQARIPLDAGTHVLQGRLGSDSFKLEFVIADGEQKTVEVPEPRHSSTPPTNDARAVPLARVSPGPLAAPPPSLPAPPPRASSPWRTLSYVTGGVGAAATLTAAALFTHARLKFDSIDCPANRCSSEEDVRESYHARTEAHVSQAIAAGGLALLGVGVTLWLTSRPHTETSAALSFGASSTALQLSCRSAF